VLFDDKIIIQFLSGHGRIPDDFEDAFAERRLYGLPTAIRKVGTVRPEGGLPVGVILNIPFAQLMKFGDYRETDFESTMTTFMDLNDNHCNFSILASYDDSNGRRMEYNISSRNLSRNNLDTFFSSLREDVGRFIREMVLPANAAWGVYVNIDADKGQVREVTGFNIDSRDFYVLDIPNRQWTCLANPDKL